MLIVKSARREIFIYKKKRTCPGKRVLMVVLVLTHMTVNVHTNSVDLNFNID